MDSSYQTFDSNPKNRGSITRSTTFTLFAGILVAAAVTAIVWVILYCFNPKFVQYSCSDTGGTVGDADPVRCLAYALIFVVAIALIAWIYTSIKPKKE